MLFVIHFNNIIEMEERGISGLSLLMGSLQTDTVLILFVQIVIVIIYLISLLLVMMRRAKRLLKLHNRKYYLMVAFYIASKLVLCSILIIQVIVGIASNWSNIDPSQVELLIKIGIVLADFSMIELFLMALETYLSHCLSAVADTLSRRRSKMLNVGLKGMQMGVAAVILIPLVVFDAGQLSYDVVNAVDIGLNLLVIVSFLVTFFYLNFKMTGIMMESRLNAIIRRIYKIQLIILFSRATVLVFEVILALYVLPKSFQEEVEGLGLIHEVMLGCVFVGSVIFMLMTEGLPIMYSLRSTVMNALNHKSEFPDNSPRRFINQNDGIDESLLQEERQEEEGTQVQSKIRLKNFNHLTDLNPDKEESIWITKKGTFQGQSYLVRISKHDISSYIFQDIQNEILQWTQLNIKCLSRVRYFCEGEIVHLVERYYETKLDNKINEQTSEVECLRLGLKLAESIQELHGLDIVHGCLDPQHIFVEHGQVILNGLGLHSLKKYLSLITGYTNKTLYTSIEHLRDKNNIILKPNKPADIYSFGIIFYQMITKNRQYRQLTLKDVRVKFVQENFRPKMPENIKTEVKSLIRKCWNESPERRPSIQEVISALKKIS